MRANARIGNKQPLVHYAGETFMKPFCSYLGLEEQRRSSHHIQNILHPLIFLFVHKLRVFYKVLKNIFRRWLFLFFLALSENAVKLRELILKDGIVKKRYLSAFLAKLRSEEHTSELQSHVNLVCRLLLEKNNIN